MKFSSIALVVSDAEKSAKWYQEKLGFEIRSKHGHWVTVSQKGLPIDIHLCADLYPLEPGNSGFSFMTKDVAKEQKTLEAKGVKFTQPTKTEEWGTSAAFADPDGNEFWIIQE
jgi:catechol 2,3-dioxygenase-like lactoylglutathione lyase family enzyme